MHTAAEAHPARFLQDMLQTVDCIYAAACSETPWEQAVAAVCQVGELDAGALSMVDPLGRRRVVLACYGLSAAAEPDAVFGLVPGNSPLSASVLRSTPGTVWQEVRSDALPTASSFPAGRVPPDGLSSWACVIVGRDEGWVVCLEVYAAAGRSASRPEPDGFLRQIAPHLTRAWRIGTRSRPAPATATASAEVHDHAAPAPDLAAMPGSVRLRAEFGLTKAEARLALRLARGSSLASAAQAFNVKVTTIRSQLQQVFAKTGTSRQTELVAMLLSRGYGNPGPVWGPAKPEGQPATL